MKTHLIKHIGSADSDYHTTTYCGMDSDYWSENFADTVDKTLTTDNSKVTCKKCIISFEKEISKFERK